MATVSVRPRIQLVDALRGFALMGILLLHSAEHFDFLAYPPNPPAWLQTLNGRAFGTVAFLFAGKSYAIFAMLFGLSFFIILDRAAQRGVNFRWRFLWRLAVLGIIGYVHSLLYCGDILSLLAVLGIPLVVFHGLGNRVLLWISALLLLQLPLVWQLTRLFLESGYTPPGPHFGPYYGAIYPAFGNEGLLAVCRANAVNGQLAKWWWMVDNGRYLQILGLFIWGLLLGRWRVFEQPAAYVRLAKRALLIGAIAFPVLYYVELHLGGWLPRGPGLRVARTLTVSYVQLSQMLVWVGGFVLLYHFTRMRALLHLLVPFGRMSLTCYVTQALFWVPMYYHFGFGLYRQMGPFYSILAGAAFFVVQLAAAHWWLRHFQYGPLEWLWRSATLLSFKTPFRKPTPATPVTASTIGVAG